MLLLLIIFSMSIYFLYIKFYLKRKNYPPGPTPYPLVGNMFQININEMDKDIQKWSQKYGNIFTMWMPDPYVVVNDYESLKEYFIRQGEIFAGRPRLKLMDDFLGGPYGLIINDNSWWKNQRRFALHVLRDFGLGRPILENTIIEQAHKMVQLLEETNGESIDMIPYFTTSIGNVIFQLVFGRVCEHSDRTLHEMKRKIDAVGMSFQSPVAVLVELSLKFKKLDYLFGSHYLNGLKVSDEIIDFFRKEVEQHRKTIKYDAEDRDYIDAYLMEMHKREKENNLEEFTEHQLLISVYDLFSAGLETTATTSRAFILYMINHPEIQEKLHAEIDNVIGFEHSITMSDQSRLPYFNACIQEIQRIAVLLPMGPQHMVLEDVTMNGYRIPKGTIVIPQFSSVHFDEKLYPGTIKIFFDYKNFFDPEKFDPSRHLDENESFVKDEKIMPFGLGKRACLGESLARMELFLFLSHLFQKFVVESENRGKRIPLEFDTGFIKSPRPYKCRAIRRN